MEISQTQIGSIAVFGLKGRLDSKTSEAFEQQLLAAIKTGPQKVLLDFSQLDYISSAGLRVLLLATRALQEKQGAMALCALKPALKNVFDIAGFSQFFPIHASLEEAASAFAK